ncbi:MAG: hypothetical protein PF447_00170, partial [Spirochaetaceae bacterium]|nr:hypothetical protein [Spirochaetaceae bacterium]
IIFQHTLDKYLKPNGQIGVVLPESLLQGGASQAGFQRSKNFGIQRIVEPPLENSFEATQRASFYLIGIKNEKTNYPISYQNRVGKLRGIYNNDGSWIISDRQPREIPPQWLGQYEIRQGINTLGANGIYFFNETPDLEPELIFPLLRSGEISSWKHSPSRFCLIPYYPDGKIIEENVLKKDYPKTWEYLIKNKEHLSNRKSRFVKKHWYGLFGVGKYTFSPYKVIWRALGAKEMTAAVVNHAMANQAMHCYIPCKEKNEAYFIAAWLNSSIFRKEIKSVCREGSKSFAQPGIMSKLPIPRFSEEKYLENQISRLAIEIHGNLSA